MIGTRYHKIFKCRVDMSTYLENKEALAEEDTEFLNRLTQARNHDELWEAKRSILRDFREIYEFDVEDADFPEPIGHFYTEKEKIEFIKKKILLHDMVLYLANVIRKYHMCILEKANTLPQIELKKISIDYNEVYKKALEDYISAINHKQQHAIAASFIMPAIIEQSLSMDLQNRMLFSSLSRMLSSDNLKTPLNEEETNYISLFSKVKDKTTFYASEKYVMDKMYGVFVREGALTASGHNEMILTGIGHLKNRKYIRTLGSLLKTTFAKNEMCPEYFNLMYDFFVILDIRNCIMHGLDKTFDYFNTGLTAIMFQLAWDIVDCNIFKDDGIEL